MSYGEQEAYLSPFMNAWKGGGAGSVAGAVGFCADSSVAYVLPAVVLGDDRG